MTDTQRGRGRPKGPKQPRQIASFTLETSLLERLEVYCQQAGLSKSEAVNRVLEDFLNREDTHDPH